jgi:hypothetical protein
MSDHQGFFTEQRMNAQAKHVYLLSKGSASGLEKLKEINMNLPPTKGKFTLEKETQCRNIKENNPPQYMLFGFTEMFFLLLFFEGL